MSEGIGEEKQCKRCGNNCPKYSCAVLNCSTVTLLWLVFIRGIATIRSSLNSFFHEVGKNTHHQGNTICWCFSMDSKIVLSRNALIFSIIVKTLQLIKRFHIVSKCS